MNAADTNNRKWSSAIAKGTFLLLTAVLLVAVIYIIRDVLHAIILGILFATLLMPLHKMILRRVSAVRARLRRKPKASLSAEELQKRAARIDAKDRSIASLISIVCVCIVIILPLAMFASNLLHQGYQATVSAQQWIEEELPGKTKAAIEQYHLKTKLDTITSFYRTLTSGEMFIPDDEPLDESFTTPAPPAPSRDDALFEELSKPILATPESKPAPSVPAAKSAEAQDGGGKTEPERAYHAHANFDAAKDLGPFVASICTKVVAFIKVTLLTLLTKLGVLIFNFCIMLFVMYQFFYDGQNIQNYLKSISPLSDDAQQRVSTRIGEVSRAIFIGICGTAIVQSICAMVLFSIVGIPSFWGIILGMCSIIPIVGTSIIWIPVVAFLILTDAYPQAIFIFITCGCIVANLDMMLRPLLMKKSGETGMSYMVLFLSILGGIQTFGLVGVIYGPLITGICSICLLIFSTQFKYNKNSDAADNDAANTGATP